MLTAPLLLITVAVVIDAKTHWSGGAFVDGLFPSRLALHGTLGRWSPSPRHRGGVKVPVVPVADGD
jgi:hypothetical protein